MRLLVGVALLQGVDASTTAGGALCDSDNATNPCATAFKCATAAGITSFDANGAGPETTTKDGSFKCRCMDNKYPSASATCSAIPANGIGADQACASAQFAGVMTSISTAYACVGDKLACTATHGLTKTAPKCTALSFGTIYATGVAIGGTADGAANQQWVLPANTQQLATGALDCGTDKYAKTSNTCEAKGTMPLGGACFKNAGATASAAILTAAKMQCAMPTGQTEGAGKLACKAGAVDSGSGCVDPAIGGACAKAGVGTPEGSDDAAKKTTATKNTFALPAGYKCLANSKLACDFAGGFKPCGTTCTKSCTAGSINLGGACGADADCKATTGDTGVKCLGLGSAAQCKCPKNSADNGQACASGTAAAMEVGKVCGAGSNLADGYACAGADGSGAGKIACAASAIEGKTSKKCTIFEGVLGVECKTGAALGAFPNMECTGTNEVACTGTNKQCTTNKLQCAATAGDNACKCAAGEIVANTANNPCVKLAVGGSCKTLSDGKDNAGATTAYACTANKVACATGYEQCATTSLNKDLCALDKADEAQCPPAPKKAGDATTAAAATTSSTTSAAHSSLHLGSAFFAAVAAPLVVALF